MMERKNRLSSLQTQKIIEHFIAGTPARSTAILSGVSRRITTERYHLFRLIITEHLKKRHLYLREKWKWMTYFGGYRKGKRGRGASGKTAVFGLYKRNGYVYAISVENTRSSTLIPIINQIITPHSIVYTDGYKSYDTLDTSRFYHRRINHSIEFARGRNHINGIENFWNQAKRHLNDIMEYRRNISICISKSVNGGLTIDLLHDCRVRCIFG